MDQHSHLDSTFGASFISMIIAAVLYGVSCAQIFYYFQHYSKKDGRGTKAVVIATLISDTVHQALITHAGYTYLITYYFQPQKLTIPIWSPILASLFSGITAFLVQTFYAVRIWRFSQKNVIVTATLFIIIVGGFVTTVVYVAKAINVTTFAQITALVPLTIAVNALAVAADVLIAVVFCILLHRSRNDIQRSNTMINLLIIFSVQTGMLTTLCAIGALISILALPNTFLNLFFHFLASRLYCNSLLTTLNVRNVIRERGHGNTGISLHPIDDSNLSTTRNHKGINVKVEILSVGTHGHITGADVHGSDGSSRAVQPTDDLRIGETEPELKSRRL